MTEYTGDEVPRGGEKVVDFIIRKNGVPSEPSAVTITWKDDVGVTQETDTLAGGGVYRPTGSTAENDPGHFRAKRLVGANETLAASYTARVQATVGGTVGPDSLLETYSVVASAVTVVQGGALLAVETDVRDWLSNVSGISLPAGATSGRITDLMTRKQDTLLARFNVEHASDLSDAQQVVAKDALIQLTVADLLLQFYPASQELQNVAKEYRRRAFEDVEASAARERKTKGGSRKGYVGVT